MIQSELRWKKGSITVFLALVLLLLFSFLLTVLEGARIQGATAYATMLNRLSGESFLAAYYLPLFEEYGIFGVDGGYGTSVFSEKKTEERLETGIHYGTEGLDGGLLAFGNADTGLVEYQTLLTNDGASFLAQVREQVLLSGSEWLLTELFSIEDLQDAVYAGRIYEEQQKALEGTLPVVEEILRLMELVDGVRTTEQGLWRDSEGHLEGCTAFMKRIVPMEREALEAAYENEEVFRCVKDSFRSSEQLAADVLSLVERGIGLHDEIAGLDAGLMDLDGKITELEDKLSEGREGEATGFAQQELLAKKEELRMERENLSQSRDSLIEELDLVLMDAEEQYRVLQGDIHSVVPILSEVQTVLLSLEIKQQSAKAGIESYELFLQGMKEQVSEELYGIFEQELVKMKAYLGLEEQGYVVPVMLQSVRKNQRLVSGLCLTSFQVADLARMQEELQRTKEAMAQYTVEGLWFSYGEIRVSKATGASVKATLNNILGEEVLSLIGLNVGELSEKKLDGLELPSGYVEKESLFSDLLSCIAEIKKAFGQEEKGVLFSLSEKAADKIALELYAESEFGCFTGQRDGRRLSYEREYLLFGKKKDVDNLTSMVLCLVAIRTLFCVVSLLKTPEAMSQLESLAASVAGMTGIPLLLSVTKYMLLFLWAVEEAFVEVAALFQGKNIPVLSGEPRILVTELFFFGKEPVREKAESIRSAEPGAGYEDYLQLLSFLQNTKEKMYYCLDLIQENIRAGFRDEFRIRNVITYVRYRTQVTLEKQFDTGVFLEKAYQIQSEEQCGY